MCASHAGAAVQYTTRSTSHHVWRAEKARRALLPARRCIPSPTANRLALPVLFAAIAAFETALQFQSQSPGLGDRHCVTSRSSLRPGRGRQVSVLWRAAAARSTLDSAIMDLNACRQRQRRWAFDGAFCQPAWREALAGLMGRAQSRQLQRGGW